MKSISLTTTLTLTALLLSSVGAFADKSTTAPAKAKAKTTALICPVTGSTIPSIKDAAGHSVYKGKTYYFCCSSCKPEFDADPAKYAK